MHTISALAPLPAGSTSDTDAATAKMRIEARKTAQAVFLTTMLESMFEGIKAEAPFGGGQAEQSYRDLLVGEYAKELSTHGGLGIADHVYREILAVQEGVET